MFKWLLNFYFCALKYHKYFYLSILHIFMGYDMPQYMTAQWFSVESERE